MSFVRRQLPKVAGKWLTIVILAIPGTCPIAGEQQFGRLFTTPDERRRLQESRDINRQLARGRKRAGTITGQMNGSYGNGQAQAGPGRGAQVDGVITLRGFIYKKDRAGMVWIDARQGDAALDYRKLGSGQVQGNEVSIRVPASDQTVKLKPGQSYHPHTDVITDLEAGGP